MPLDTPSAAFTINRPRSDNGPIALLPMLGVPTADSFGPAFSIDTVDAYYAALHATIGDTANTIQTNIGEAAKALGATPPQAQAYARLSFMPDPANYGLVQWPGIQPESLRKVARENIAPQMIIRSRVADIRRYSSLSSHPWSPGWRIGLRQAATTPTAQDRADIKEAEHFIWNCSREQAYKDPRDRDAHLIAPWEGFLCGAVDDMHTFDGWAIWTDRDRAGRVRAYANLPAGLIRLSLPGHGYRGDPSLFAALVDETGNPVKAFTRDEMTWKVRNVRVDPGVLGYGWPEIEIAIALVQAFQSAIQLNADTFQKSGIPNGILKLKGDFWQQEQIDALMREWTNMKRGLSKLWGIPVIAVPENGDIEVMPFMDMKGQEIRYKDHMNMMMGCCCIVYQFPVRRLGMFASGNHRDNHPLNDAAVEVQGVDDPGLPGLLSHIENTVNEYLLQPNWPRLKLEFMNKNPKEDARAYEARKLARTWGEARAEADLPTLETLAAQMDTLLSKAKTPAYGGDKAAAPELPEIGLEDMARIMSLCPEDPVKAAVYQTLATVALQSMAGGGQGDAAEKNGPRMLPAKDPAKSQAHGHRAGVRRSEANEPAKPQGD